MAEFASDHGGCRCPQISEIVEDQSFILSNFRLQDGTVVLLEALGVKHLVAVAGPSYGGYQAFQWAVAYPDWMDGIVPVVTAPKAQNVEHNLGELQARLAADPEWNGGRYYDRGGAKTVLTELRVEMLKRNGIEGALAPRFPDRESREAEIRKQAVDWARR